MKNFYTIQEFFEKMNDKASFLSFMRIILQAACIITFGILFIIGTAAFIIWDFPNIGAWVRALLVFGIIFILNLKKW